MIRENSAVIWAVGGGKGGVGKTMLAANIGVGLAQLGNDVVVADTDLGGANLHSYLGVPAPDLTINDFFLRKVSTLDELLVDTPIPGLRCLPGSNEIVGMANPRYFTKLKFMRHVRQLPTNYIILDVGAGTSYNTLDLFSMADTGVVITLPEKPAIESAYGFIKATLYRSLLNAFQKNFKVRNLIDEARNPMNEAGIRTLFDLLDHVEKVSPEYRDEMVEVMEGIDLRMVLNFVAHPSEYVIGEKMRELVKKYLNLDTVFSGVLPFSTKVRESLVNQTALLMDEDQDEATAALLNIINRLKEPRGIESEVESAPEETPADVYEEGGDEYPSEDNTQE